MDIDVDLNKTRKIPASGQGAYAGGMDFQGAPVRRVREDRKSTTRKEAPNVILKLGQTNDLTPGAGSVMGAYRISTSSLPLSGPQFPTDHHSLLPSVPRTWSLILFLASSFDGVAGLTFPADSIGMVGPEADGRETRSCEELLKDDGDVRPQ